MWYIVHHLVAAIVGFQNLRWTTTTTKLRGRRREARTGCRPPCAAASRGLAAHDSSHDTETDARGRQLSGVHPISIAHRGDVRCGGRPHGRTPAEGRRPTCLQYGV